MKNSKDTTAKDSTVSDTVKEENKEPVVEVKEDQSKRTSDSGTTAELKKKLVKVTGVDASNLNPDELSIVSGIVDYIVVMSRESKMTDLEGANQQFLLYKTLISILSHDPKRFKGLFKWTLDVIASNRKKKGAFHDKYVMRYYSYMHLSAGDLRKFKSLMNIINITADIKNRKLVQTKVNINPVIEKIKDPIEKANLTNFYFS